MRKKQNETQNRLRRVLVLTRMFFKPDRERLAGILRYAAQNPGWEVIIFPNHPANEKSAPTKDAFDGLITTDFFMRTIPEAKRLSRIRPAVIFGQATLPRGTTGESNIITFAEDNHAVGFAAADFFRRKGLTSFGFVGTRQARYWSDDRRDGFIARLKQIGFTASVHGREPLMRFLKSLPKPCGVFAAYDIRAKDVIDACRAAGITVPSQVGVLGVDNEDFLCETSVPTLSSIEYDTEEAAFRAAEILDQMMDGRRVERLQHYGIKGIVERLSTSDLSGASRIVAIAKEYIRRNISTPITAQDVATACRVSLRLLQRGFATVLDDSPANYIRNQRLALVRTMLTQTQTPIEQIGRLCGLPNSKNLKSVFRTAYGMTMREFRQEQQAHSP